MLIKFSKIVLFQVNSQRYYQNPACNHWYYSPERLSCNELLPGCKLTASHVALPCFIVTVLRSLKRSFATWKQTCGCAWSVTWWTYQDAAEQLAKNSQQNPQTVVWQPSIYFCVGNKQMSVMRFCAWKQLLPFLSTIFVNSRAGSMTPE